VGTRLKQILPFDRCLRAPNLARLVMHQNPLRPKKDLQLSLDSVLNQKVTPARESLIVGVTRAVRPSRPFSGTLQKMGIGADQLIGLCFAVTSYVLAERKSYGFNASVVLMSNANGRPSSIGSSYPSKNTSALKELKHLSSIVHHSPFGAPALVASSFNKNHSSPT